MKLIPLLCIVFIKSSEGCNHQNDEKLSKFHTLIRGNEISIRSTGSSQERWHIIRDSICKAKLTCKNFYIPPSKDCLKSSLEVIDGDLIKLRFCGYSSILGEYILFTKAGKENWWPEVKFAEHIFPIGVYYKIIKLHNHHYQNGSSIWLWAWSN